MDVIGWDWLSRMGWDGARHAGVDVGALSILSTHLSGLMHHWSIEPFIYDSRASMMQFSLIRPCAYSHNKWEFVLMLVLNFETQMWLCYGLMFNFTFTLRYELLLVYGMANLQWCQQWNCIVLLMKARVPFWEFGCMFIWISFKAAQLWFKLHV